MPNLMLVAFSSHPYQAKLACAYLYYGSEDALTDHKGQSIKMFDDFPGEFMDHLKTNVMPKLNEHFEHSLYTAVDVDVVNQESYPFIVIQRKDGKILSKDDITTISHHLSDAVAAINNPYSENEHKLFSNKHNEKKTKVAREKKTETEPKHHYNLRG